MKNLLSYQVTVKVNIGNINLEYYLHIILQRLKNELLANTRKVNESTIAFETDFSNFFWRYKIFEPALGLFCLAIDSGRIHLIDNKPRIKFNIHLSFVRLFTTLMAFSFLSFLVGFIYLDLKFFSWVSFILILSPILLTYLLSLLGYMVFMMKMKF